MSRTTFLGIALVVLPTLTGCHRLARRLRHPLSGATVQVEDAASRSPARVGATDDHRAIGDRAAEQSAREPDQ